MIPSLQVSGKPGQAPTPWYENFRDALTGTQLLEVSTGLGAMWFDNGQYYDEGPLCGVKMECFTETSFSYGTITLGHTINSGQTNISAGTQVHEYGHVLDVEEATPLIYYPAYGVQAIVSWISDTVSGEDADWHDSNLMEKTSDADERRFDRTEEVPTQGFISDFWDEVFG